MNIEEKRTKCSKAIDCMNQLIGSLQEDAEKNKSEIEALQEAVRIVTEIMPIVK